MIERALDQETIRLSVMLMAPAQEPFRGPTMVLRNCLASLDD